MTRTLTTSAIMYFNPLPPHGGRRRLRRFLQNVPYFNPLPPHGGRLKDTSELPDDLVFQSTPSTRRETNMSSAKQVIMHISIHSLHTEGDPDKNVFICSHDVFQSTPSTRRETTGCNGQYAMEGISIHSLHTEGDSHTGMLSVK